MKTSGPAADRRRPEFERLYQQYSREVWAVIYARWLNADLAQEVMQEAFLRLWQHWQAGEEIYHPRAWLLRVARNLAEDQIKSAFHRNGTQGPQRLNGIPAPQLLPLEYLERQELFAQIHQELQQLSASDREILTLRYALDYEVPQISEVLGIHPAAVHMRLSRARQRLARRLVAQGVPQPP
jgi:RNA polymerase sigma-70 factor (ECF subfamily)